MSWWLIPGGPLCVEHIHHHQVLEPGTAQASRSALRAAPAGGLAVARPQQQESPEFCPWLTWLLLGWLRLILTQSREGTR